MSIRHSDLTILCVKALGQVIFLCLLTSLVGAQEADSKKVSSLIDQLKHGDGEKRRSAGEALRNSGERTVPQLIEALKDPHRDFRSSAAWAPGKIGPRAEAAVSPLIDALKDPDLDVRTFAAFALGKIRAGAAVPQLVEALRNDPQQSVRFAAGNARGEIGASGVKEAVPPLIEGLRTPPDQPVSLISANALETIGAAAVSRLIPALKDRDPRVRSGAVPLLGKIGGAAKEALPELIEALRDPDESVRLALADDLGQLSTILVSEKATGFSNQLKTAADIMRRSSDRLVQQHADRVQQAADLSELLWWEQLKRWVVTHPIISLAVATYPLLLLVWFTLLWLRPLWLLHINELLAKTTEIKLPAYLGGFSVAPRYLVLVGFFHYQSRVLDAWVTSYIDSARKRFSSLPTVKEREIYVSLPVVLGGEPEADLSPHKLRAMFSSNLICLQVWGEGGAGKTSLAGQLAHWAMAPQREARLSTGHFMLPVLIEQDLVIQDKEKEHPLFRAIKQQVKVMINEDDPPPSGLLRQLLKKRRVLVLIDGFSEMNEVSHTTTLAGITDLPVNAVIITTRTDEQLTGISKTEIKPLRVRGNRLSTFMEAYFTARKKRDLFEDDEFFESCRRLSLIVGDRDITALLAKLYAEQMITVKEGATDGDAPENIPELMLSYLNDLCRGAGPNDPDIRIVHRAAKKIAWECLKKTLRPTPAQREEVLSALGGEEKGKPLLKYLEEKLKVVQTVGAGRDRIRFALDPLAEYLAGMHLADENGEDEQSWRSFLAQVAERASTAEDIKGFLLAVRDCYLTEGAETNIHSHVSEELAKLAGINPEDKKKARTKRRVKRLIQDLKLPDTEERVAAARALGNLNQEARAAIPALIGALTDKDYNVRSRAAYALGSIGPETKAAVPALTELLKDHNEEVRRNAAYALGGIGLESKAAVPALIELLKDQDEIVRRNVADALGSIGVEAKAATAALVHAVKDQDAFVRRNAAYALGAIGPEAKAAVPALIEALRHQDDYVRMGAADALSSMGSEAKAGVPGLIRLLKDEDTFVRRSAAQALGSIGPEAKAAVPTLAESLKDQNEIVRRSAVEALGGIGREARLAIPALIEFLEDQDAQTRLRAAFALGCMGAEAEAAVPALIELLKDQNGDVRSTSADALGKIGPAAVPALDAAPQDENAEIPH